MLVHPQNANTKIIGLSEADREICFQPNAIDIIVDKMWIYSTNYFELSEDKKIHRSKIEMITRDSWDLTHGSYEFTASIEVHMGSDEVGWLIPRSTLNRNGVMISSGLYDSGYTGVIGGVIHIPRDTIFQLYKGTRIAQFLITKAESTHMYNGSYQSSCSNTAALN
jgi:dUTP pyrophosphatase